MNRALFVAAIAASALTASAEGYQINTLSAKQQGMGHTGVALKLGAESQFFNPAGMAFMDANLDIAGSVTAIAATAKCTTGGSTYTTDNGVSTPLSMNVAFSIFDNFKAGLSFYTPYGSSINWGESWPGACLNQKVSLKTFTLQPSLAWRILPNLSVGAGLMITWGNVNLDKGLIVPSTADLLLQTMGIDYRFGHSTPASINLQGTSDIAVGVNIGAMYDITSQWTIGVSYRSHMDMKVKRGMASVSYLNEIAQTLLGSKLNLINNANFEAQMPCPYVLNFGVSYRPIDRLVLAAEAQLTGWKAYKQLDVCFLDEQVAAYNQHIEKNYSNAWAIKVGAQLAMTSRLDLRAGLMVDTSPVNELYYNPETPGMTKLNPSVGLSFRPIKGLSFDLGFVYVAGLGTDGASCSYPDLLATQISNQLPASQTFTADYSVHAFVPSVGVSYRF